MNKYLLELYSDYLISAFGHTTATGLSKMTGGAGSHDKITRFLSEKELNFPKLWRLVKPLVREFEDEVSGVLIIDDTIEEKPYTDESELVCWHYDHSKGRNVKGMNLLSTLYRVGDVSIPVAFELVKKKTQWVFNKKKEKWQRKSLKTKNELYRRMLEACQKNQIEFRYVLNDVWYASENMRYIKEKLGKEFIMPLKANRKVALSLEEKKRGEYEEVGSVELEPGTMREIYVEQVEFPLFLVKQVFKNEDGSEGVLYLVSSDVTLDNERLTTIYKKRWKVEEYHKSLKSNASLAKSPTKPIRTQSNHVFASIYAFVKLERMKMATKMNHFALRSRMYLKAVQAAFKELQSLRLPDAELGSCVR
jgi:DDE superfamily endonuclease